MTEQFSHRWYQSPLLPAALIAACIFIYGYSRDFGVFIFAILLSPVLLLLVGLAGLYLYATFKTPNRRRECYLAIAIIMAAPLLTYFLTQVRDQAHFLTWAPFHIDLLRETSGKDGVITLWDGWGFAGNENDSFLVRSVEDRLTSLDAANAWAQRQGSSCEIVRTERVWRQIYVLTTYNCGF